MAGRSTRIDAFAGDCIGPLLVPRFPRQNNRRPPEPARTHHTYNTCSSDRINNIPVLGAASTNGTTLQIASGIRTGHSVFRMIIRE